MPPDSASRPPLSTVDVELGPRSYAIRVVSDAIAGFGPFVHDALQATWAGRACRQALIVTDENVAPLAGPHERAIQALGLATSTAILPPGEPTKNLDHAADLYDQLVSLRADRHALIVAIGGGVVGDLAGFVAATYARGVPLLMVPTTLLAQVDSSVGGKVGVNLPRAKNIVGAFHQPIGVWVDTEVLKSLPPRELRCGLAEVVKYGIILDAEFFEYLERHADALLELAPEPTRHIVATSCRLKADVVTRDEREESGLRAVLNFGHTIGHAVEAVAGYDGDFRHGEAVAVGMVVECRIAERLGWVDPSVTARVEALLRRLGLPTAPPAVNADALLAAMSSDKKNRGGRVRFVLPRRIGHVELTDAADADLIREALRPRP